MTATSPLWNRTILVTGVVDDRSLAYATARCAAEQGATVILTAPGRDLERTSALAPRLAAPVYELDVVDARAWSQLDERLARDHPILHGALHAIAYAPIPFLDGRFVPPPDGDLAQAMQTSVTSYASLAELLRGRAPEEGASLVGLTFDPSRAWPTYNWMGVLKAALEATSRYIARDLGPSGVRSNLIAAGPLETRAASAIPGFSKLLDHWRTSPLPWDPHDADPVGEAACFLLSDAARAITGEVLHVDGGRHAVA
jgi:enoyl ACP reductase